VPSDSALRKEFSAAKVVICSVRLTNGETVDIIDYAYKQREDLQDLLKHCEEADIEIVGEHP
jgi:hypothetical protein